MPANKSYASSYGPIFGYLDQKDSALALSYRPVSTRCCVSCQALLTFSPSPTMSNFLRNGVPRKENGKIDFTWKRHYGFTGVIWVLGWFVPPLAVAIRFGIGKDFFINVILTICGYIPGHLHNWFIQNIRNNESKARTPKWAVRYGLVDDRPAKKLVKSRAWTARYNDRTPQRVVYDDEGNPHVVAEENAEGAAAAPLKPQNTGLVDEDRWINADPPSQSPAVHAYAPPAKGSKRSRFFKRNSANMTPEQRRASITERNTDPLASNPALAPFSANSSASSLRSGPEDPTRQYGSQHSASSRTDSTDHAATTRPSRLHEDVFAHEF